MVASKFAVQYQTAPVRKPGSPGDSVEIVRSSKMQWAKIIDPDHLGENPFRSTQRVLARLWIGGDSTEIAYCWRTEEGATAYFESLKPRYLKLKSLGILDVEGPNEPQATVSYKDNPKQYIADWNAISRFEAKWCALMGTIAMRPWVFSNSTGTPELEALIVMLPAFYAAIKAGGGWSDHEYSAPSVRDGYGWYVGRIEKMLKKLAELNFPRSMLPVFISEGGIDGGVIDWNAAPYAGKKRRRGWRDWKDWVYTGEDTMGLPDPQGGMNENLYWRHLSWMDDRYCEIPEVVAFTPFVTQPDSNWPDFTIDSQMVSRMAFKHETDAPLPAPSEALPEHESVATADKVVWWWEELDRQRKAGNIGYAERIFVSYSILAKRLRDEGEPVQTRWDLPVIRAVRMPMLNTKKAWYETTQHDWFDEYDAHPHRAEDMNLESGGNSDLGEPLVAPFAGLVIHAGDYGGWYGGIVTITARQADGQLVSWSGRHMRNLQVKVGDMVAMGQPIGQVGDAGGRYSAHLHHQIAIGMVPGPLQDWRDDTFKYVRPSQWFQEQGIPAAEIQRLMGVDGR